MTKGEKGENSIPTLRMLVEGETIQSRYDRKFCKGQDYKMQITL